MYPVFTFKHCILLLFLFSSVSGFSQYISRAEPYPYACPVSICSGESMAIKFNNMENFSNGTEIKAYVSNNNFSSKTALTTVMYSFDGSNYTNGSLYFSSNQSQIFMVVRIPETLPAGTYKLKVGSSSYLSIDDFNCTGGTITVNDPPSAPALTDGEDTYGDGAWIGHVYWWKPSGPVVSESNYTNEDFFNPNNYLGYFTSLSAIDFDNIYYKSSVGTGVPGTQGTHYQVTNVCDRLTNFTIRFRRSNFPTGIYTFTVNADDGVRLSTDGGATWITDPNQFIEKGYDSEGGSIVYSPPSTTESVCLSPSSQVVVEYFQRPDQSRVTLSHTFTAVAGPVLSSPSGQSKCNGEDATFSVSETTGSTLSNYQWKVSTDGGVTYSDLSEAAPYSNVTTQTLTITAITSSMNGYLYKAALNEGGSCDSTAMSTSAQLTVINCNLPTFTIDDYCAGEDSPDPVWSDTPPGGYYTFNNTVTDGASIDSITGVISDGVGGSTYAVKYMTTGDTVPVVHVNVFAAPTINQAAGKICKDSTYNMSPVTNATNPQYQWAGGENSTVTYPTSGNTGVSYSDPESLHADATIIFTVTVTDNTTGCSNTNSVAITFLDCDLVIPNVYTPNSDGVNDFFEILNIQYGIWDLIIYNRWGNVIYKKDNYLNEWKGEDASDGVYYYILSNAEYDEIYKGFVHVMR